MQSSDTVLKRENHHRWRGGVSDDKSAYARRWRKDNESRVRDREYRKRFGITLDEYDAMVAEQGGLCAICLESCPRGRLCVDHDHSTGKVRGLLCRLCNLVIGQLGDDHKILSRAVSYLEKGGRCASQE